MTQLIGRITIDIDRDSGDVTAADLSGLTLRGSMAQSSAAPFSSAELVELESMNFDPFPL